METNCLESLWNLLNLRRFFILTEHGQDPFDELDEIYRVKLEWIDMSAISCDNNEMSEEDNDLKLTELIRKNKRFVKMENLYNLLDFIYKFIIYELIPLQQNENIDGENQAINPEFDIEYILNPDLLTKLNTILEFDLNVFNLANIKLKNIFHLWMLFIKIYLDINLC